MSEATGQAALDPGVPNEACLFSGPRATSAALPRYLHDGTELRLILHLLLGSPPLDTGQDRGLEEVPPVVMEYPEKELKQLSLHVRGGALQRPQRPSNLLLLRLRSYSQPRPRATKRSQRCLATASCQLPTRTPVLSRPPSQQVKPGVLRQRQGCQGHNAWVGAKGPCSDGHTQLFKLRKGY